MVDLSQFNTKVVLGDTVGLSQSKTWLYRRYGWLVTIKQMVVLGDMVGHLTTLACSHRFERRRLPLALLPSAGCILRTLHRILEGLVLLQQMEHVFRVGSCTFRPRLRLSIALRRDETRFRMVAESRLVVWGHSTECASPPSWGFMVEVRSSLAFAVLSLCVPARPLCVHCSRTRGAREFGRPATGEEGEGGVIENCLPSSVSRPVERVVPPQREAIIKSGSWVRHRLLTKS